MRRLLLQAGQSDHRAHTSRVPPALHHSFAHACATGSVPVGWLVGWLVGFCRSGDEAVDTFVAACQRVSQARYEERTFDHKVVFKEWVCVALNHAGEAE